MTGRSWGQATRTLWRGWSRAAAICTVVAAVGVVGLDHLHVVSSEFVLAVGVVVTIELALVGWLLGRSVDVADRADEPPAARVTLATAITVFRAGVVAVLAGFLLVGGHEGPIAWVPGTLFAVVAALDAIDGAVARATNEVSRLGERLDHEVDALAVLVGAAIVVIEGYAPVAYLVVGAARYCFVLATGWRRSRGFPVADLPPSRLRTALGATQMVVIWLALLPVPGRELSRVLTTIAMVPFLAGFVRDWLVVTGRIRE